jgi:hypothetical protein
MQNKSGGVIGLALAASMLVSATGQAMMVGAFNDGMRRLIIEKTKQLCGAEVVDADEVPTPIISDADRVIYRNDRGPDGKLRPTVLGYEVNRSTPLGIGDCVVGGWHFISPNGNELSTILYSTSAVTGKACYPDGAGKWSNFSTATTGQVAYLTQFFTVEDGVRVTRWNKLCRNVYHPTWDAFQSCLAEGFADYTAARLCQGF